ncbi:MAG: prepilin-type N-terminal cleavage/methylation domain-containing protein [Armatimonadota bacterium]|nr:prepilin-type N-terminal cleavage/methylation domain-containing protein [bacterium]
MRKSGFTLIELLVVIAIIAILAAILFPVFIGAKAKAQQTQCLSNLKQLSTAFFTYAQNYDGKMPVEMSPMFNGTTAQLQSKATFWNVMLMPYAKSKSIFCCPSDALKSQNGRTVRKSFFTSYRPNGLLIDPRGDFQHDSVSWALPGSGPATGVRVDTVTMPSKMILAFEFVMEMDNASTPLLALPYAWTWEWGHWGSECQKTDKGEFTWANMWARHNGGSNWLMADGHAKWLKPSRIRLPGYNNDADAYWKL